ncbi:MAG: glycerophosphodiester phosphodiesterase [Pseudomonadota bacterium]|nr:MAG: glycerophosphodiester phosphodiesterase [Pseudomonadota bacterium]
MRVIQVKLPKLIAHRGYPHRFPENSLAGFAAAIAAGARFIEVDVQLSADGVPVLFHDRTLARVSGQPGGVHEYSLQDLAKFHASERERFGEQFAQTPIARLNQLVELLTEMPQVGVFVELKRVSIEQFGAQRMAHQVLPLLMPLSGRCVVISFSLDALAAVRGQGWAAIGAVINDWSECNQAVVDELKPEYLFCRIAGLPSQGELVYPHGQVAVFATADPEEVRRLAQRGAQFVETDNIGALHDALAQQDSGA